MKTKLTTGCDLCNKEATVMDSWFLINSCEDHKHISPVARQSMPSYRPKQVRTKGSSI